MPSVRAVVVALPVFLSAAVTAATGNPLLTKRVCVAPTNCGDPVGDCEYCCAAAVVPNSAECHSHGEVCADGTPVYHCDDATR